MQHYAGRVTYDAASLLEKNRNFFPPEVIQLLRTSTDPIGIIMEPNMALIMQIFKLLQTLKKKKLFFLIFCFSSSISLSMSADEDRQFIFKATLWLSCNGPQVTSYNQYRTFCWRRFNQGKKVVEKSH